MAKNNNQCEWYDYIGNKPSKLHRDLIGKLMDRPQGNYLYALYKTSDMAEKMDAKGYKRNTQGQHSAQDILAFIDWYNISKESLGNAEKAVGAKDADEKIIDYTDPLEALRKADEFNDTRSHLVANVYEHGGVYNIVVSEKNSRTFQQADSVKGKLKLWEMYQQAFAAKGIDITSAPQEIQSKFSAFNDKLIEELQNIKRSDISVASKSDALLVFFLNPNSPHTRRIIDKFGSIENAAQAIYEYNMRITPLSREDLTLLKRAFDYGKQFSALDIDAIQNEAATISQDIKAASSSDTIEAELHRLNKKYHIEFNETHRVSTKINSLSEAAAEAVINLERQIRELEKEEGTSEEAKRLSWIKEQLLRELANKKYYSGIINFLSEASQQLNYDPETGTSIIDEIIREAGNKTGTDLEKAFAMAAALQKIKDLGTKYYPLVSALADENLSIDESIEQEDIDSIRNAARELKNLFDKQDGKMEEKVMDTMEALLVEIIGDETPEGVSIHNAIRVAAADSTMYDYLYSIGRVSNPIIASMGKVIRSAHDERNAMMRDWALRTRRITDRLYESGSDSKFMYEDEGHIASPYDWKKFYMAKNDYARLLKKQKLDEWEIKQALENWEQNNTEDLEVDEKTHRKERVPNHNYLKPVDFQEGWTQAQKDYYKEMMQIKGEIGSLFPAYAQKQFLPPQVRRSTLDAIGNAKSIRDLLKVLKNMFQNIWKVREDDTDFAEKGVIIDGQERVRVESDFDNTKLRRIPIFHINRVEKGELLTDFSGALSHLAGTAANYHVMNKVADVVEFMGDFAKNQPSRKKEPEADVVGNRFFKVVADVEKKGKNSNTENLVNSYIAQFLYGQKIDPEQEGYKWAKLVLNLIGYTSFKGLATNFKGMFSNYVVGEYQMLIEAGAGEFYGLKDYLWAHTRLFGGAGVGGEIAELLTNNVNHKSVFFRELFDPTNDDFSEKSNTRYYKNMFRQLVGHDCSFIGYAAGEYLIHYVNMYSILHNQKAFLNGKEISLYDAYEVVKGNDNNSELKIKQGVTIGRKVNGKWEDTGEAVTPEYEEEIRNKIRFCNQNCHGSMNEEDKGAINQKLWGRAANNFRQWMWEHYSRRFRKLHYDYTLGEMREGYWVSLQKLLWNDNTKEAWKDGSKKDAVIMFLKDLMFFTFRAQSQWSNLNEMQKHNVKRVHTEMMMYVALLGLGFALGAPEDHKKDFWRRWWIYQVKRLTLEAESAMPNPNIIQSGLTIIQSPVPSVNTANSLLYSIYGLTNGDLGTPIKSGPHKGEDRYIRNMIRYNLPFFKDFEQLQRMDEDESLFQVFQTTPYNR